MLSAPSPSPVPQGSQLQSEIPSQWNPYVIGPLIAVCIAVLFFSYYGILKRLCWAFITLTFSRNRVQMRLLNGDNLQDLSSFQFHSHGLESTIRHSLPVSQFKKKEEEPRSCNHECAVCLGEFEDGEWLKYLPICGHVFHVACIDTWFQTHSNCPLCRSHVCDLTNDCSISMNTLLESLRREDFFHERAQHYQILRSVILHNSALGPEDLEQRANSLH